MKTALFFSLVVGIVNSASFDCTISVLSRANCGFKNEEDCVNGHCCWDPNGDTSPRCFHPANPCLNPEACVIGAECQNLGDGQFLCTCAEDNEPSPECRGEKGSCKVRPGKRVACGKGTREDCENRNCCYDNSRRGTKWCFHSVNEMPPTPQPTQGVPVGGTRSLSAKDHQLENELLQYLKKALHDRLEPDELELLESSEKDLDWDY